MVLHGLLLLIATCALPQDVDPLRPGAQRELRIDPDSETVDGNLLPRRVRGHVIKGQRLPIRLPAAGTFTLEASSVEFDAFLVLLNGTGVHVAHDDNGGIEADARIVHTTPSEY
jgi:hypothetical protein